MARWLGSALVVVGLFAVEALLSVDAVDRYERGWDERTLDSAALLAEEACPSPCKRSPAELNAWHEFVRSITAPSESWRRSARRQRSLMLTVLISSLTLGFVLLFFARHGGFGVSMLFACVVLVTSTLLLRFAARPSPRSQTAGAVYAAFVAGANSPP